MINKIDYFKRQGDGQVVGRRRFTTKAWVVHGGISARQSGIGTGFRVLRCSHC
jgi:hypothetical protein